MKKISAIFLLLIFAFFSVPIPLAAQEDIDGSTDIVSDKMTYSGQDNIVVFSGNVHVVRPDFELWADELRVFLKEGQMEDDREQQESIEKIVASGKVRIQSEQRQGFSDLLTYYPQTGVARLEENPRLVEDQNSVEGETIILNMKDNTSEVLGGADKRVRVIFHSDGETQE
ncbi:MAG: LptA/OstA family protein [Desulfonatronovibrio sp.]